MRQFQCVPTTYVTGNKVTIFKFTLEPSIMSIVFASFKHLKLTISIIMPITIPQIVYILLNKSLARILIQCPNLNKHETFYFYVINMHGDLAINVFSCPPDKM